MFIRSQDNEELREFKGARIVKTDSFAYINPIDANIQCSLGDYKSVERCIEVLNFIQLCVDKGCTSYNMPKE